MAMPEIIRSLYANPTYAKRIVHNETTEPESPRYGELASPLSGALEAYLRHKRIRLYSHQCEAINHVRANRNVIITTPTASGKDSCLQHSGL